MFYEPAARDRSVLPHDPFKAILTPRPIGWISTVDAAGAVNLAPYSFFNAVASTPVAVLAFSSDGRKDSVTNAESTGAFVWNMPTFALRDAMNATAASLPHGQSEFDHAGLRMAPSRLVAAPRVADSPVALECRVIEVKRLTRADGTPIDNWLVLGEVVGVHIDDALISDGRFNTAAAQPLARCGYQDYAVVDRVFSLQRPG